MKRFSIGAAARLLGAVSIAGAAWLPGAVQAQAYPSKPITMIIPFAPGSTDLAGRIIAEGLGNELQQRIVVENRPGAGGAIGARAAVQADPDGYTILVSGMNNFAFPYALEIPVQFNLETDLSTIYVPIDNPLIFVTSAQKPPRDMKALVAYLKASPQPYLSAGPGTSAHVLGAAFLNLIGAKGDAVHYKSSVAGQPDLIAGRLTFLAGESPSVIGGLIREGKVIPHAVFSATRLTSFPEIPTMEQAGISNVPSFMKQGSPLGVYAHSKTPENIQLRLNDAMSKVMQSAPVRKRFEDLGVVLFPPMSLAQARAAYRRNLDGWKAAIEGTGIKEAVRAASN